MTQALTFFTPRTELTQSGFTLVEMAITLTIVGLIVGGTLVGANMIRAAELNKVISEKNVYWTAFNTFRTKYAGMPGDLRNATDFWPAAPTCPVVSGTGLTCNGNGDHYIGIYDGGSSICYEVPRAWQHLSLAGMIPGQYDGIAHGNTCAVKPGDSGPTSGLSNTATWSFWSNSAGLSRTFSDFTHINLIFGSYLGGEAMLPTLTADDARMIDEKSDDGKPGTGYTTTFRGSLTSDNYYGYAGCTSSDDAATAVYDISQTGLRCALLFTQD